MSSPESGFFKGLFPHVPITGPCTPHGTIQICPVGNSLRQTAPSRKLTGKEEVFAGEVGGGGSGRGEIERGGEVNTKRT